MLRLVIVGSFYRLCSIGLCMCLLLYGMLGVLVGSFAKCFLLFLCVVRVCWGVAWGVSVWVLFRGRRRSGVRLGL